MSFQDQEDQKGDEKTNKTQMDQSLVDKIESMANEEIFNQLLEFINTNNSKEFIKWLTYCSKLEDKTKIGPNKKYNSFILNVNAILDFVNETTGESIPLITCAVYRNDYEIAKEILKYGVRIFFVCDLNIIYLTYLIMKN